MNASARAKDVAKRLLAARGVRISRDRKALAVPGEHHLRLEVDHVAAHLELRVGRPLRFVQIGAYDGVTGDPLHHLILARGWQGVLVEPQPRFFAALQANYAGVNGLTFRNAAISEQRGRQPLYSIRERPGLPEWVTQAASFTRQPLMKVERQYGPIDIDVVEVETLTIEDVFAELPSVDLLQVDVEGYDAEIIGMLDLGPSAPSIIRFEHKHLAHGVYAATVRRLAANGYLLNAERYDTLAYRYERRAHP